MLINKIKGQTTSNLGVHLPEHAFSHGKLYVALSRGIYTPTKQVQVMTE